MASAPRLLPPHLVWRDLGPCSNDALDAGEIVTIPNGIN